MEKIYAARADIEVHPIAQKALAYFFEDDRRTFTPAAVEDLKALIYGASLGEVSDLSWACMSLCRLAAHIHMELKAPTEATKLLEALTVALPAIRSANEPVFQAVRHAQRLDTTQRFFALTGTKEEAPSAPAFGAPRPEGTVGVGEIRPRRVFR